MIHTLAIANYRSLLDLVVPLGQLNLVVGANGSGKSNLYRALRLLADAARGGVVAALAREGGLNTTFWAGPETLSRAMRQGEVPVQGGPLQQRSRLRLGFAGDDFGYALSLGYPQKSRSLFALDPEIKRETIWAGNSWRPAASLVERNGAVLKVRGGRAWQVVGQHLSSGDSLFDQAVDPERSPETLRLREQIRGWRFYDHLRSDGAAPARQPQLGTRTPVLGHDGSDLAAALATIQEIGDAEAMDAAIADAFPGTRVTVDVAADGRFLLQLHQQGLLRPLSAAELSDGTLRYLCWVAALLTPRPPPLMVLNEPETSLHPDLLPALARLVARAAEVTQVWVVSHASRLVAALESRPECHTLRLEKELGATRVVGQGMLDMPAWRWPDQGT